LTDIHAWWLWVTHAGPHPEALNINATISEKTPNHAHSVDVKSETYVKHGFLLDWP
jgi:hypothetical protein